eukprot:4142743-Ditylum_brightwellii.AAC.1
MVTLTWSKLQLDPQPRRKCCIIPPSIFVELPSMLLHQISSLEWMRKRESRTWTEADSMVGDDSDGNFVCGDLHKAATGGASVYLAPREKECRDQGYNNSGYRLETRTGRPYDFSASGWVSSDHNPTNRMTQMRKIARGGLLCDDPGLGKTIT